MLDLVAVDVEEEPGGVGPEAGEEALRGRRSRCRRRRSARRPPGASSSAEVAAVLDHDLEPAGGAQALDRRGAEDVDQAVGDLVLEASPGAARRSRRPSSAGLGPVVEVVEHHVHRAEVRGVGVQQDRLARRSPRCARRPAPCRAISSIRLITCWVVLDRGRVGQLDVDQQVALVLRRDEPGRGAGEAAVGQVEQAAVDQQHQHADPQQPADDPGVHARRALEAGVEQPEEPAQEPVRAAGPAIQPASAPATTADQPAASPRRAPRRSAAPSGGAASGAR